MDIIIASYTCEGIQVSLLSYSTLCSGDLFLPFSMIFPFISFGEGNWLKFCSSTKFFELTCHQKLPEILLPFYSV